jgi:pSer/pThr/pTyr-binding forkhead associated (FHA) protein
MKRAPAIVVQLVHIHGPLKGEIQEIAEPEISIGRYPEYHVHFPKNLAIVSREHAWIKREGNRFKVINKSRNGTFLNGKRVEEAYLKDGDVLMFAEGGPKVSFLTKMVEGQPQIESAPPPQAETAPPQARTAPPEARRTAPPPQMESVFPPDKQAPTVPRLQPQPSQQVEELPVQRVQAPLIIQYGPTLQSFKELPITIGRKRDCAFALDHPGVLDRHAQIFFSQGQYWVKDLTGQNLISINGRSVHLQACLNPDDILGLSPQGPNFRFLGGGRLAEVEQPQPEKPLNEVHEKEARPPQEEPQDRGRKGAVSILKKFLHR